MQHSVMMLNSISTTISKVLTGHPLGMRKARALAGHEVPGVA